MKILLTNDDGIEAPGILTLADKLKENHEVYICAPIEQRSGYSHAVTYFHTNAYGEEREIPGIQKAWAVNGTPADCAYLGIYAMMDEKPDLLISGINQGQNMSADIMYSGTIGAACEGIVAGVPSMAVSYCSYTDTDFSAAAEIAEKVIPLYMSVKKKDFVLSVNVPELPLSEIKGYKLTYPQSPRNFERKLIIRNEEKGFHILMGEDLPPEHIEPIENTDTYEVSRGYVSLTPVGLDYSHKDEQLEKEIVELLKEI